jgi:hypothetical protein
MALNIVLRDDPCNILFRRGPSYRRATFMPIIIGFRPSPFRPPHPGFGSRLEAGVRVGLRRVPRRLGPKKAPRERGSNGAISALRAGGREKSALFDSNTISVLLFRPQTLHRLRSLRGRVRATAT